MPFAHVHLSEWVTVAEVLHILVTIWVTSITWLVLCDENDMAMQIDLSIIKYDSILGILRL